MTLDIVLSVTGRVFLLGDDVNTDIHCSNKYLPGKDPEYIAAHAYEQLVPTLPAAVAQAGGGILVAGEHFGINSSREQAVHVMKLMKIKAIVAKSFGRQFFRNAINNGMPLFQCNTDGIQEGGSVDIDFVLGKLSGNESNMISVPPLPFELLAILKEGGLIPFLKKYPDWKFQ